jgi:hypothetical protein
MCELIVDWVIGSLSVLDERVSVLVAIWINGNCMSKYEIWKTHSCYSTSRVRPKGERINGADAFMH